MIRIHAGQFAGRVLEQPATTKTRPMSAKVRASIFNRLGDIEGLTILDAYAGSGAVGLEALSLGAQQVTFVEQARSVAEVIKRNIATLGVEDSTLVISTAAERSLDKLVDDVNSAFDIIIADPPYAELSVDVLGELSKLIKANGLLVVSRSSRLPTPEIANVSLVDERSYGDTTISYYRKS